jgi:hypothetical protein
LKEKIWNNYSFMVEKLTDHTARYRQPTEDERILVEL